LICKSCEVDKCESDFPVRNDRSGRLRPYCRKCASDIQRARYWSHRRDKPFLHRCSRAGTRATSLGVPFNLTPEYLEGIWTGCCPVIGVGLNLITDRRDEYAAELDRFDPRLGYVQGNVNWISRKANRLKNNVTIEVLEELIDWMKSVRDKSNIR